MYIYISVLSIKHSKSLFVWPHYSQRACSLSRCSSSKLPRGFMGLPLFALTDAGEKGLHWPERLAGNVKQRKIKYITISATPSVNHFREKGAVQFHSMWHSTKAHPVWRSRQTESNRRQSVIQSRGQSQWKATCGPLHKVHARSQGEDVLDQSSGFKVKQKGHCKGLLSIQRIVFIVPQKPIFPFLA